jgi:dipeptidase D
MDTGIEPILSIFGEIAKIPRCSGKEEKIIQWIRQWSETRGFQTRGDPAGNLVVMVPASRGFEQSPGIALQGHLDMVCEKTPDSAHDFSRDPVKVVYEGDWIKADGTTLGSDNGIGVAMALALASDDTVARPPLELLFTVDEETGLSGATNLLPGILTAKILLNLDSEMEGEFTVGCAGGQDTRMVLPVQWVPSPESPECFCLKVQGLKGGHSGIDIHLQRANAIQLLARAMDAAFDTGPLLLASIFGGKAHNAIPREAAAIFRCPENQVFSLERCFADLSDIFRREYAVTEPQLQLSFSRAEKPLENLDRTLTAADTQKLIRLLMTLPHGVYRMSDAIEGLVETSSNLAKIEIHGNRAEIQTSQRSSMMSRLDEITRRIQSAAWLARGETENHNRYPSWEPDLNSRLLEKCKTIYRDLFGSAPGVHSIHAGLECGVIGAKHPGMEMISFGPTITGAHSPEERVHVPSIEKVWIFLRSLVASIARQ